MRIHLFATDRSALDLAKYLGANDRIVAVIVPENRQSKDKVRQLIEAADLPVGIQPRGEGAPADLPDADAAVSWLYSQIIPMSDIAKYEHGILNMHGGKLPEYRGASVLQWAIVNGESELGITWHQLESDVDTGPVWAETAIPIPPDANALTMRAAMIDAGLRLFPAAWRRLTSGGAPIRTIAAGSGTVWPQRRPQDGTIGARWPEARLRNLIRALPAPWPLPTLDIDGRQFRVLRVASESDASTVPYVTAEGRTLPLQVEPADEP